ncbi:MAG: hypothetical protein K8R85_14480, partial [Bacteroidetes bacterium]|nr:hypothetical protein [Bacteroidota bacterium]
KSSLKKTKFSSLPAPTLMPAKLQQTHSKGGSIALCITAPTQKWRDSASQTVLCYIYSVAFHGEFGANFAIFG